MPEIKMGENGEVLDVNTGKPIGRITEKGLVLNEDIVNQNNEDRVVETTQKESTQNVKGNLSETNENDQKRTTNDPVKECKSLSSFVSRKTKYEITKETNFIIRFGLIEKEGRFIVIRSDAVENFPNAEECWVKFRMWNYEEELEWKNQSQEFSFEIKSQFVNQDKLNEKKIKRLLLDWSFAENNDRLKLLHTDGVLSDESYNIFKGLFPNIANSIVDLMNSVLEQNQ